MNPALAALIRLLAEAAVEQHLASASQPQPPKENAPSPAALDALDPKQ